MPGTPAELFEVADHLAGNPLARAAFERRVYGRVVEDAVDEDSSSAREVPSETPIKEFFD